MQNTASDEYIRIPRPIHPDAMLPEDLESMVWHYMDWWKLKALAEHRALYFRRLDLLQDQFEGRYSAWQIADGNKWLKNQGCEDLIEDEKKRREEDRQRFFVNCWCMNPYELELLWKGYTNAREAVAIQSRVSKIVSMCDQAYEDGHLDVSLVSYVDHLQASLIGYADGFAPAVHKDRFFEFDHELRIVHRQNFTEPPDHVSLPITDMKSLIERIVLAPESSKGFTNRVRRLLSRSDLEIPVERSRADEKPAP